MYGKRPKIEGMRISLTIEEEDIERIVKALDTQYAYAAVGDGL